LKILYITFGLPVPPDSGARIRDFNLISRIAQEHEVSVLSLLEFSGETDHMPSMRQWCRQVDGVFASRGFIATLAVAIGGWFAGRPLATAPYYYPALARKIRQLTSEQSFDVVQIEHSFLAPYRADVAPNSGGATVLSLHNIGVHQYRSMLEMSRGLRRLPAALKWLLMRGWEAPIARRFDLTVVVSGEDRARLEDLHPPLEPSGAQAPSTQRIRVVENGVDCAQLQPLAQPQIGPQLWSQPGPWPAHGAGTASSTAELIFVGTMGYLPNRDAMEFFVREVLPLVRRQRPDCRLTIVGSGGRRFLSHLAEPRVVEITDRVEDLAPYYQRAHVAIAPLRSGGGSRLKILEAMALGRPVVSTRVGYEGLTLEAGKDLLVADDAAEFAGHVLSLLADRSLWQDIANSARQTVAGRYDWSRVTQQLLSAYRCIRPAIDRSAASPLLRQWNHAPTAPRISVIIPVYNSSRSLDLCLDALERSHLQDFELIVVDDHSTDGSDRIASQRCANFLRLEKNSGPSAARNRGAALAHSELLFFLDADVLVEPETLQQVLQGLDEQPGIAGTFCAYQNDTPAGNFVSQYKNLLHHYTHQISAPEAATFCGGYGAILREVFQQLGGFDEGYRAMEDVELGYRLHQAGQRILLSPQIQLTHTKRYSLTGLVRADVLYRAIPWTRIMLQRRIFQSDLNLRRNNVASVAVVFLMILAPLLCLALQWFSPAALAITEIALLALFLLLNLRFLSFLWRLRGPWFALRSVPMLWLQYVYSGIGFLLGSLSFIKQTLFRSAPRGQGESA
jgi:GT2 family glycosyltransferase/glycosyltransferase involved in cell wall biosynthesis